MPKKTYVQPRPLHGQLRHEHPRQARAEARLNAQDSLGVQPHDPPRQLLDVGLHHPQGRVVARALHEQAVVPKQQVQLHPGLVPEQVPALVPALARPGGC